MRPDMEEYEDIADEENAPRSRAMSWLVLIVAVGGFAALASYAYRSGKQSVAEGDMLVVEADPSPIKSIPADTEGEQFPNKDKTIYDVISPNGQQAGGAEKLLPDPESPSLVTGMDEEDTTAANDTSSYVKNDSAATDPVDARAMQQPAPTVAAPVAKADVMPTSEEPVTAGAGAPTMINEKPAPVKTETAAPVKAAATPKPVAPAAAKPVSTAAKPAAPKPATAAATGGSYMIQLGSFKSEAEARATWSKIAPKYSLGGSPSVTKADVNGATFYRLRTGSYASATAAKAACAKMAGQACIPVAK